jgi:tetratricopeptide (TPR) repeat protein
MQESTSWMHRLVFLGALLALFVLAALALATFAEEPPHQASCEKQPEDFGAEIRPVYFRAIQGDREALGQALEMLEAKLAAEPDHPEALVYHGSLEMAVSGDAFEKGDREGGRSLWAKGLREMDRSVEVAPERLDVRIPRGATLLFISREVPPERAAGLLRRSVEDYGAAYAVQKDHLAQLSTHARGELLLGLADGYQRLGDTERADDLFRQAVELLPGTEYATEARAQLEAETVRPVRLCLGCHQTEE